VPLARPATHARRRRRVALPLLLLLPRHRGSSNVRVLAQRRLQHCVVLARSAGGRLRHLRAVKNKRGAKKRQAHQAPTRRPRAARPCAAALSGRTMRNGCHVKSASVHASWCCGGAAPPVPAAPAGGDGGANAAATGGGDDDAMNASTRNVPDIMASGGTWRRVHHSCGAWMDGSARSAT
jgi:hypothetical protein